MENKERNYYWIPLIGILCLCLFGYGLYKSWPSDKHVPQPIIVTNVPPTPPTVIVDNPPILPPPVVNNHPKNIHHKHKKHTKKYQPPKWKFCLLPNGDWCKLN